MPIVGSTDERNYWRRLYARDTEINKTKLQPRQNSTSIFVYIERPKRRDQMKNARSQNSNIKPSNKVFFSIYFRGLIKQEIFKRKIRENLLPTTFPVNFAKFYFERSDFPIQSDQKNSFHGLMNLAVYARSSRSDICRSCLNGDSLYFTMTTITFHCYTGADLHTFTQPLKELQAF